MFWTLCYVNKDRFVTSLTLFQRTQRTRPTIEVGRYMHEKSHEHFTHAHCAHALSAQDLTLKSLKIFPCSWFFRCSLCTATDEKRAKIRLWPKHEVCLLRFLWDNWLVVSTSVVFCPVSIVFCRGIRISLIMIFHRRRLREVKFKRQAIKNPGNVQAWTYGTKSP